MHTFTMMFVTMMMMIRLLLGHFDSSTRFIRIM